jgi:hypothetical protein
MINAKFRKIILILAVCAAPALTFSLVAQTNIAKPTPAKKAAADPQPSPSAPARKAVAGPFRGKLSAVDKASRTITVGKRTFLVTQETKIKKDGKAAGLGDAVIGEQCSGYVKPNEAGKLVATTLNLGPKTPAASSPARSEKSAQRKQ